MTVVEVFRGLEECRVDGQVKLPTGHISPLALRPIPNFGSKSAEDWSGIVKSWGQRRVQELLARHGSFLIRGVPIETAQEFSDFLHGFGWKPHEEVGNPVKRLVHAPNVANANEGPPSLYIPAHSEFGISSIFPSNICFWCRTAPTKGGETPISSSQWAYQRLQAEAPEFVDALLEKGVRYTIWHPASQLSNDANGNGVLAAWGEHVKEGDNEATVRRKVEEQIQRISPETTWRWEPNGGIYTFQRLPAFRIHPVTGQPVVFGNITSYFGGAKMRGTLEPPYIDETGFYKPPPLYGDDSPIPLKYLDLLMKIVEDIRSVISWQKHDMLIIDGSEHWVSALSLAMDRGIEVDIGFTLGFGPGEGGGTSDKQAMTNTPEISLD